VKQIYDFEQNSPPVLNENMLRVEQEKRRLRLQTTLLFIAGLLFQIAIILLGFSAIDWYPWLTAICFGYVIVSTTGGGVVAVTYTRKGGVNL